MSITNIQRDHSEITSCSKGEWWVIHTRSDTVWRGRRSTTAYVEDATCTVHVITLYCCAWSFGLFCQCRCWPVRPCSSYGHVSSSHQHIWPSLITVGQQLHVWQQFVQETWLSEKWHVDNRCKWSCYAHWTELNTVTYIGKVKHVTNGVRGGGVKKFTKKRDIIIEWSQNKISWRLRPWLFYTCFTAVSTLDLSANVTKQKLRHCFVTGSIIKRRSHTVPQFSKSGISSSSRTSFGILPQNTCQSVRSNIVLLNTTANNCSFITAFITVWCYRSMSILGLGRYR